MMHRIQTTTVLDRRPSASVAVTDLDVVVPVYNEAGDLELSIRCLDAYLAARIPFSSQITIADNANTDGTAQIAQRLAAELPRVRVLRLDQKGHGRALRAAWSTSEAQVLAYMDVDLSTDLDGLLPLVAPLLSGHSDISIGSRLARGSNVTRAATSSGEAGSVARWAAAAPHPRSPAGSKPTSRRRPSTG